MVERRAVNASVPGSSPGGYAMRKRKLHVFKSKTISASVPEYWIDALCDICAQLSIEYGTLVTIPDLIRRALIRTYILSNKERLPFMKRWKPRDLVYLPSLKDIANKILEDDEDK